MIWLKRRGTFRWWLWNGLVVLGCVVWILSVLVASLSYLSTSYWDLSDQSDIWYFTYLGGGAIIVADATQDDPPLLSPQNIWHEVWRTWRTYTIGGVTKQLSMAQLEEFAKYPEFRKRTFEAVVQKANGDAVFGFLVHRPGPPLKELVVRIPLWFPTVLLVIAPFTVARRVYMNHRRRERLQSGRCGACGYDLSGSTSGRCSECGAMADVSLEI